MTERTAQMPENEVPAWGGSIRPKQVPNLPTSCQHETPGQAIEIEPPRRIVEPSGRNDETIRPNRPESRSALAGRIEPNQWRGDPAEIVVESLSITGRDVLAHWLVAIPDWQAEALCREHDPDLWFPSKGQPTRPALLICGRCPVRAECLEHAITEGIDHGVWGGMTAQARAALRRARREVSR